MRNKDISSVLVSSKNSIEAVGIVTERDILYRVVAENKGPFKGYVERYYEFSSDFHF